MVTDHGEVIRELIGRATEKPHDGHSLAHITLPPGKSSLLHYHPQAEESFYILEGHARMRLGDDEVILGPGQAVLVPPPVAHKIINIGETDLKFLAVCIPAWEATNSVWLEENVVGQIDSLAEV